MSDQPKFTPGPWRFREGPRGYSIFSEKGAWIAIIKCESVPAHEVGNTNLITTSPDVWAEASFLIDRLTDFDNDSGNKTEQGENEWHGHVAPSISRLKKLLAKVAPA